MKFTFLGTGTSQGIPIIACECAVCTSTNPHDKRLRTAAMIESDDACIVIDAGPDFRQQMLLQQVKKLDAIVLTHGHKDHIGGLDDLRAFNYIQQKAMKIYCNAAAEKAVRLVFYYAFGEKKYPGVPEFDMQQISSDSFTINALPITPIPLMHSDMPILGFRFVDLTYITDANFIPASSWDLIKGSKILIINALRHKKHNSHFTLNEALEVIEKINPEKAYLTHISHQLGLDAEVNAMLPANVSLAYDGLQFYF